MISSRLIRRALVCGLLAWCLEARAATDPRPVVGPGATKEEVINAYGWPNGQSQSGTKEILSYAQGEVVLDHGRVERVNFSPDVPWQPPRPRPVPATASTRKTTDSPVDFWVTSFSAAVRDAQKRDARILALFTGSDWSPASRQFHEEVESDPNFINAFAGDFVFLKLDYPRGSPVPAKISEENLQLRDRYGVTEYPTLLLLSATGEMLGRVDLNKPRSEPTFQARVMAAVREARNAVVGPPSETAATAGATPKASEPPHQSTAAPTVAAPPTDGEPRTDPTAAGVMLHAGVLIVAALVATFAVIGFVWYRLFRDQQATPATRIKEVSARIEAAADGIPDTAEMSGWARTKLSAVVAGLAEYDNYAAHIRPQNAEIDVELRKRGDVNPRVLVCCAAGVDGVVSAKRVRQLFGSMTAEGVDNGWFVSPAGFSPEAREFAASHRIVLVAGDGLHNMMREVPPVSLPKVLVRE